MMLSRPLLAAIALAGALVPLPAYAAEDTKPPATLVVVGHANIERAPDQAVVRAEISTGNTSATIARKRNDDSTSQIVQAIRALGLPERALRTTNYRSSYVPRDKDTPADALVGFVVTREIEITTAPANVEAITHALQTNGVSEIDGITTSILQRKSAYEETLATAVNDAQTQAQMITRAAHLRLVRILTIDASQTPVFAPRTEAARAMSAAFAAPAAADVELSATVSVTYEVAPK